MINKTHISNHAFDRLVERTSLHDRDIINILDSGYAIDVGTEPIFDRKHWLFYSKYDGDFFVAIRDEYTGKVVTILTEEYHENLAWKLTEEWKKEAKQRMIHNTSEAIAPTVFKVKLYYYASNSPSALPRLKILNLCSLESVLFDNSVSKCVNYIKSKEFKVLLDEKMSVIDIDRTSTIYDGSIEIKLGKQKLEKILLKELY